MAEYDLISKQALLHHLDMAIECEGCPRNTDRKTYYDRCACSEIADICDVITDFPAITDIQTVEKIDQLKDLLRACGKKLKYLLYTDIETASSKYDVEQLLDRIQSTLLENI